MAQRAPDFWKEIAKWALGLWAAAMLGLMTWMNSRLGLIQDQFGDLTQRVARIETMSSTFAKQLDAIQPGRIAEAARRIDFASRDIEKASTLAFEAATALKREADQQKNKAPSPPPR